MNYSEHYRRLVERAKCRELEGYFERHHILPRCLGGDNSTDNIVRLTAREHYIAHQLLIKMFPGNQRLSHGLGLMAARGGSRMYGWLRARHAVAISKILSGKKKKPRSPEHAAKLSAAIRGKKYPPRSPEHCAKIADRMFGNRFGFGKKLPPRSQEYLEKQSKAHLGQKRKPEDVEKTAAFHRGRKRPPETGLRISAALKRYHAEKAAL